jgi:Mn-containing catalase
MRGSWNQGDQWNFISDPREQSAVDGGAGDGSVQLKPDELAAVEEMAKRSASDPDIDPTTGAELGEGPGGGASKAKKKAPKP